MTTYLVKYLDGVEVLRSTAREETTVQPIHEVTSIGTHVPEHHGRWEQRPNATAPTPTTPTSACPSDRVGCGLLGGSGSGNGPAYAHGPLRIVGFTVYDLDRERDGIGWDA